MREPERKKNTLVDQAGEKKKLPFSKRVLLLLETFIMPGMFVLCIAGGVRNAGGYVWAYNTELFFEDVGYSKTHIQSFMSWIPLVAGSIGAVVGGIISDILVKGRGPYMRIWVLIASQVRGRGTSQVRGGGGAPCMKGPTCQSGEGGLVWGPLHGEGALIVSQVRGRGPKGREGGPCMRI